MKYTNEHNLHPVIYKLLTYSDYDDVGDAITASSFNKSVREYHLTQRHKEELSGDALDNLWAVFGSALHLMAEQIDLPGAIREERLNTKVNEMTISGKFDLLIDNQIHDWKTTSVWTKMFGERLEEWRQQLSIYRWLWFKVKGSTLSEKLFIHVIYKDWAFRQSKQNFKNMRYPYPENAIETLKFKALSFTEVEELAMAKVVDIQATGGYKDDELPFCTDEENWKGKKCAKYCNVFPFCNQAQEKKK